VSLWRRGGLAKLARLCLRVWAQPVAVLVSSLFRFIRVRSLASAHYRVNFPVQVTNGGD
jgi:hypothetical protein